MAGTVGEVILVDCFMVVIPGLEATLTYDIVHSSGHASKLTGRDGLTQRPRPYMAEMSARQGETSRIRKQRCKGGNSARPARC